MGQIPTDITFLDHKILTDNDIRISEKIYVGTFITFITFISIILIVYNI